MPSAAERRASTGDDGAMYRAQRDKIVGVPEAPSPDVGAPLPAVLADEFQLYVCYIASEPDPDWNGTHVNAVSPDSNDSPIAIVRFLGPYAHMFGPPNDEAFSGHPLSGRGLAPYSVSEVRESSWIAGLEAMNSVHPYHRAAAFKAYRHYIFAFHDSTFECVAEGLEIQLHRGSILSALALMNEGLRGGAAG